MNDPEAGVKKHHDEKNSPPLITPADGQVVDASLRTQRGIKTRHALMIAIGGTIGTGLFVGTGEALAIAGPAPLLGVYVVICILVYGIITAISEMSTYLPVPGCSMAYYANRFVSRSLGFALGCCTFTRLPFLLHTRSRRLVWLLTTGRTISTLQSVFR